MAGVRDHGAEVSDTLKYFSERIPATFVYGRHRHRAEQPALGQPGTPRSSDGSLSFPLTPSPTALSGKGWSVHWNGLCCCTGTAPAP